MSSLVIDLRSLVNFYDSDKSAGRHSNAVKSLAGEELGFCLMTHYFESLGKLARRLPGPCTPGGRSGQRLDGWYEVVHGTSASYYQVEVKSWSFHGYGPKEAPLDAGCRTDSPEFAGFLQKSWTRYWDNGDFKYDNLKKVLKRMKPSVDLKHIVEFEPLACLWSPMNPGGEPVPFFSVPTAPDAEFPRVWIFSASTYARLMLERTDKVTLNMPDTARRIEHLTRIFK